MPYKTTWKENGIVWKFFGYVTAGEIEEANEEFYRDERSDAAKYQVIDALEVSKVEWNEIDIKEMAAHDKGASLYLNRLKVAYISDDEKVIGVLKKYMEISRILNSSWKFKGFTAKEPAMEWVQKVSSGRETKSIK